MASHTLIGITMLKMRSILLCRSPALRRAMSFSTTAVDDAPFQVMSLSQLAHRGRVELRLSDRARTKVEVVPVLAAADCELRAFGGSSNAFVVTMDVSGSNEGGVDTAATAVRVTRDADAVESSSETRLQLFLPPLVSLDLALAVGDVNLRDKLEGDVKVVLGDGDIRAHKLRGDVVSLKTNRGAIDVAALVEGESVKLAASAVTCKRLMAASAEIKIGKSLASDDGSHAVSELGAIYSPACVINTLAKGSLQVGNVHGYLRVVGEEMQSVHVHSVNGALDVEDSGKHCAAVVHFDSLALDASSSVLVGGDVSVSVEPTAAIEVELHGSKITTDGCAFTESEMDQLDADYAIFSGALQATQAESSSTSSTSSSGKINVGSAKSAAMRTSFFMSDESDGRQQLPHPAQLPRLLVHATSGAVRLEQLDWMAKLKRKHLKPQA